MAKVHRTGKAVVGLLVAVLLAGCGVAEVPDTVESNSLVIEKEGTVTAYTVGVFDKEYYNLRGLRSMAQEEAAAYNTVHQTGTETPVKVVQVDALQEDQSVVVAYRYSGMDVYTDYNGVSFFYGTVKQAEEQGYDLAKMNQVLFDAKGKKSIVSSVLTEKSMAKKHLALVEEAVYVYCPYPIDYISEGARMLADGSVDTTGVDPADFPVIILMRK